MAEHITEMKNKSDMRSFLKNARIKKNLKAKLDEFSLNQKNHSVSKKRDVNRMLAARCRVSADKAGPSAHELLMEQVGGSGMMKPHIRQMCAGILKRLGVVQL
jgi:hypothetical protein